MQSGQLQVPIRGEGPPDSTPSTALAMALATLGIEVDPDVGAQHLRDRATKAEQTIWILRAVSGGGKYHTPELVKCWDDRAWLAANRAHPFALMRRTWDLRTSMLRLLKSRPSAPPAPQGLDTEKLAEDVITDPSAPPAPQGLDTWMTSPDTALVAGLRAWGGLRLAGEGTLTSAPADAAARAEQDAIEIPLFTHNGTYLWRITDADPSLPGKFLAGFPFAKLRELWHDREWQDLNPEHPIAYAAKFLANYRRALEHMRELGPALVIRRGNRTGVLTRHTTEEHKKRILAGINAP